MSEDRDALMREAIRRGLVKGSDQSGPATAPTASSAADDPLRAEARRRGLLPQETPPAAEPAGPPVPPKTFGERVGGFLSESAGALEKGLTRDLPEYVWGRGALPQRGSLVGDFFRSLLPGEEGARAGGRTLQHVGEVGTAATGGLQGPLAMPPPAGLARGLAVGQEVGGPRTLALATPRPAPPTPARTLTRDFAEAEVRPSVPAVTGRRPIGSGLPGSPVAGALERTEGDIAAAAERAGTAYGSVEDPYSAGNVVKNAMGRYAADKTQAATDYRELDRLMFGAKPTPVTNTLKSLNDLKGKFPHAPELEHVFANPKLRVMSESLTPRTETIPARTSSIRDPSGRPIITAPAQTVERGGVLNYGELKELRTRIGYLIENPSVLGTEHIPRAELRRVYAAITNDLQVATRAVGPAAVKALNRATISYGVRMRAMERLEPLLKIDSAENVFQRINNAASATGSADAQLLNTLKKTMKPEEWNEVSGAVIRRLGRPTPALEIRDPLATPEFSSKSFVTNYNKLSGRAKDQLFGEDAVGSPRAGLETLSRVARAQTETLQRARTGGRFERAIVPFGGASFLVDQVLHSVVTGKLQALAILGYTGSWGLSKLMMSPGFTQWMYRLPQIRAPDTAAAVTQASALLEQALKGGLPALATPPEDDRPTRPPTAAQRQKQSDLSWDRHFANRRGDLDEYQRLNRQLA